MKLGRKILSLKWLLSACILLPAWISNAKFMPAQYNDYSTHPAFRQFVATGKIEYFENVPEEIKTDFLADIIFFQAMNAQNGKSAYSELPLQTEEQLVLQFYEKAPPERKTQIDTMIFNQSFGVAREKVLQKYFILATQNDYQKSKELICGGLTNSWIQDASEDPSDRAKYGEFLAPLVRRIPHLSSERCLYQKRDGSLEYFQIGQWISESSRKAARLMADAGFNAGKNLPIESKNWLKIKSHCTVDQLNFYFMRAARNMMSYTMPVTQILSVENGNCILHGFLTKTESGFIFENNASLPGLPKSTIEFTDTTQIPPELLP